MTQALRCLVYRSTATITDDDVAALDAIFRSSIKNNRRDHITGCLVHPDGRFVQVIEGDARKIDELMIRIRSDTRHRDVVVLGDWEITGRLFSDWAMARPDSAPLSEQAFSIITLDGTAAQVVGILLKLADDSEKFHSRFGDVV